MQADAESIFLVSCPKGDEEDNNENSDHDRGEDADTLPVSLLIISRFLKMLHTFLYLDMSILYVVVNSIHESALFLNHMSQFTEDCVEVQDRLHNLLNLTLTFY